MKKKFYSIFLIFALMISLVPASFISYADTATDEYSSIKAKFDKISYEDAVTALSIMNKLLGNQKTTYEDEIKSAVDELKTKENGKDALVLLEKYDFIDGDNYKNCGMEKVLEAIRDVQFAGFSDNPYTGKSFLALADDLRGFESKTPEQKDALKKDVLKAYEYIYKACPKKFKDLDFSKYGESNTDKAKTILQLAKDVFDSGDKLVMGTKSNIEFMLPEDYMKNAKKSLNITLTYKDEVYEEAIQVFLDVLAERVVKCGQGEDVIAIAKKLGIYYGLIDLGGGITIDLGGADFSGKVNLDTPKDEEIKQMLNVTTGIEAAGPIVDFKFVNDDGEDIHNFEKPVKLVLPVANGEYTSQPSIFYYNEKSNKWEYQETTETKDGKVMAYVNHFSIYGVLKDEEAPTITDISKSATKYSIKLNIKAKDNDAINHYLIRDKSSKKVYETTNAEYTITGLDSDTTYNYEVKVRDNVGNESDTKEVSVTTIKSGGSSGGGSGSGGSGGSSSDSSKPSTSNDEKGKTVSEETVSSDAVDVKTVDNKVVASVKKEELTKAVEKALDKKADETKIKIKLDNVKGLNAEVSLPVQALSKLKGKDASLTIQTKELDVNIPVEDLDLKDEKASIKLDVKELAKDEVKKTDDIQNVAKVVELSLLNVNGDESTNIDSNFKSKVTVGINIADVNMDKEKSVVLRINDNNTEIVGGKIKNGKIYANLEHFSKYAVVERNVTFEDISNHWSKQSVESMASKGIVNGYDEKTFNPDKNITRAEFAKILVNELELEMVNTGSEFNDMNNHWAKDYVNTAYKAGLIKGYDGNFNPNDNITRAQMATMIGRAIDTDKKSDIKVFNDSASIPDWSKEDLSKAVGEGYIKGSNGLFRPNDNATRAESTAVIYRMYNK